MSLICLKCDKVKGSISLYDDYNYTLTLYFLKESFYNIKKRIWYSYMYGERIRKSKLDIFKNK